MKSRIIRPNAIATLLLLFFMLWPVVVGAVDLIWPTQQDLLTANVTLPKALAAQSQTGAGSTADGMAVSAIWRSNHLMLYQCRYNPLDWSGDVIAYLAKWEDGRLVLGARQWQAAGQFQSPGLDWRSRRIVTYGGNGIECRGVPFRWNNLSMRQQIHLLGNIQTENPDSSEGRELVAYLRGKPSARFRQRTSQLGDIMNGKPVLVGRTLFVGANDGMLHAFDAFTGRERFSYVPNLVFGSLRRLGSSDYHQQSRYYVDATPTVGKVLMSARQRSTYLVGGLGRGGRGYYCLLLSSAEREQTAKGTGDVLRQVSIDEYGSDASEEAVSRLVQWEYPAVDTADDAMDNDGDGIVDEPGEIDPHLGYSFSQAYPVNANAPLGSHRPVVIFGNGYHSSGGRAVLYVLEAHSGRILRKIDTGVGGRNGLSTPALIDVDLDRRIDYAYAGDLKGNLWKFDLTATDPAQWGVAFAAGAEARPQPLYQATGLSITGRPDVMAVNPVCNPDATGVMVIFATGAHPGFGQVRTRSNAIFGVWDNGVPMGLDDHLVSQRYSGSGRLSSSWRLRQYRIERAANGKGLLLPSMPGMSEEKSIRLASQPHGDRTQMAASRSDDGQMDHVAAWSMELSSVSLSPSQSGERITGTVAIRGGRAVVTSYLPGAFPGPAHGAGSRIYVLDACTGVPVCDADGTNDYPVAFSTGLSSNPVILKNPSQPHIDHFLAWDSEGRIVQTTFSGERQGGVYWRQNLE